MSRSELRHLKGLRHVNNRVPASAQRLSQPRTCAHCGDVIPRGTDRPRLFCDNACRQAAFRSRRGRPPKDDFRYTEQGWLEQYRGPKNNPRAGERGSKTAEKSGRVVTAESVVETAFAGHWPLNLVGGQRFEAPRPDPTVLDQIFSAELGVPVASAVSDDGVAYTITPRSNGKRGRHG
jgi:hypothetical protein